MYLVVYLSCRPSQSNPSRQRTWCSSALAGIHVDGLDAKSAANYYTAIFSQQFILVFVFKFSLSTLQIFFNLLAKHTGIIIRRGPSQSLKLSACEITARIETYSAFLSHSYYILTGVLHDYKKIFSILLSWRIRWRSTTYGDLDFSSLFLFMQIIAPWNRSLRRCCYGIQLRKDSSLSCTKKVILE